MLEHAIWLKTIYIIEVNDLLRMVYFLTVTLLVLMSGQHLSYVLYYFPSAKKRQQSNIKRHQFCYVCIWNRLLLVDTMFSAGIEDVKDDLDNIESCCIWRKWYKRQHYCYVCIWNNLLLFDTISANDIEKMTDDLDNMEFGCIIKTLCSVFQVFQTTTRLWNKQRFKTLTNIDIMVYILRYICKVFSEICTKHLQKQINCIIV